MSTSNPARLPVTMVVAAILVTGCALIRLGVARRAAEQRASAMLLAQAAADSIERRLERISASVTALAAEMRGTGSLANFETIAANQRAHAAEDAKLFFVPR